MEHIGPFITVETDDIPRESMVMRYSVFVQCDFLGRPSGKFLVWGSKPDYPSVKTFGAYSGFLLYSVIYTNCRDSPVC